MTAIVVSLFLNASNNLLYCNASEIGLHEKFTMTDLSGALSFKGSNNLYISSADGASTGMICDRNTAQAWEYFNWTYLQNVDIVTSITDELAANGYKVFPNPAQRSINVSALSSSLSKNPTIIIYDMGGKAVINTIIKSATKRTLFTSKRFCSLILYSFKIKSERAM